MPAMSLSVPRKPLFVVSCGAMFVFGMIVAVLGTLFGLPEMRERLAIDLAQQGELFSLLFIGLIAATVVGGPTLDRFGSKPVLVGAAGSVTAALLLFGAARGFGLAGTAAALPAWRRVLNIGANAMVPTSAEDCGRRLNL
jgi:MFS family permease